MNKLSFLCALIAVFSSLAIYSALDFSNEEQAVPDIDYVKNMDFQKFMGVWYNIASLPNLIEKGCKCPQTVDSLQQQLVIDLSQSCLILGHNITSKSKAIAKTYGYGNWVNWNGPISAPYWILKLDSDYQWTIIGQPSRKGFWIMSRTPTMKSQKLQQLIKWGEDNSFDLSTIQYADQSCFTQKLITDNSLLSDQ